jgi:hypothetical protein
MGTLRCSWLASAPTKRAPPSEAVGGGPRGGKMGSGRGLDGEKTRADAREDGVRAWAQW